MMFKPDLWTRSFKLAVAVTFFIGVLLWVRPPQREDGHKLKTWFSQSTHTWSSHESHEVIPTEKTGVVKPGCPNAPEGQDIVVTVKTGASEAAKRLPTQLKTTLRCPPNILHFSDLAQTVENITLHDSLAAVAEFIKVGNSDFDLYRKQKARQKLGWKDEEVTKEVKEQAWNLDKYKNLHIVQESWNLLPKKRWYLHIDADTYLFWPSLLHWLPTLDDSEPLYTGSLTCFSDVKSAHGGSGILISEKATRAIVVDNTSTVPSWDADARAHCCGDELVARALKENGVEMHNSWPIINGDYPATIPFGSQYWCEPIVTMHHLSVEDMEMVHEFEKRRKRPNDPVTYRELFKDLVYGKIPDIVINNWDNGAEGIAVPDCPSFEQCASECEKNSGCFQASFDGKDCTLGTRFFKLGLKREPEGGKVWQSMWNKYRIYEWAKAHGDCSKYKPGFHDAFVCK